MLASPLGVRSGSPLGARLATAVPPESQGSDPQRIALVIQYVGHAFKGWQRQPNGHTVQAELEQALESVLGYAVTLHAAGRTDSGVHAAAQVAHFDVRSTVPAHRWAAILNSRISNVLVRGSAAVPTDWHSRFSAIWRRYRYTVYTDNRPNLFLRPYVWHYYQTPLDAASIQAALDPLVGRHHLAAFHRAGSSRPHSWVDVQEVKCVRDGPFLHIEVQASGFLYGMMRLLVGMLVQVGSGELKPTQFTQIWSTEQRDLVKYAAPPQGLCLLRVGYPEFPFPPDVWYEAQPLFAFPPLPG
jgi:tRNA pseudouridine38-40 synthase